MKALEIKLDGQEHVTYLSEDHMRALQSETERLQSMFKTSGSWDILDTVAHGIRDYTCKLQVKQENSPASDQTKRD